jgi:cardiolipin synthase A/B
VSRSLIVLPNDTATPILEAVSSATTSLRIKLFSLSDPMILRALMRAHKKGVQVRVMLNRARRSGEVQNVGARRVLAGAGIDVIDTNPAYDVTHEKSMVIDDTAAVIGSLNWEPENFTQTRDYAVVTRNQPEVDEVIACFEADWSRQQFQPWDKSRLVWCPDGGREHIAHFIDSARKSLYVQNERYQDTLIVEHLVRAKLRGVKVHVMSRPAHSLRSEKLVEGIGDLKIMEDVGIGIRRLKHLRLHAKMLLADRSRAIIGSINLTSGSFDKRRELAIQVKEKDVVGRLMKVVEDDWERAHPIDLSEEALRSDLEKHKKLTAIKAET